MESRYSLCLYSFTLLWLHLHYFWFPSGGVSTESCCWCLSHSKYNLFPHFVKKIGQNQKNIPLTQRATALPHSRPVSLLALHGESWVCHREASSACERQHPINSLPIIHITPFLHLLCPFGTKKKIHFIFVNKTNGTIYGKYRKRGGVVWIQKEDCRSRIYLALKKTLRRSHCSNLMTGKCHKTVVPWFMYAAVLGHPDKRIWSTRLAKFTLGNSCNREEPKFQCIPHSWVLPTLRPGVHRPDGDLD